MKRLDLLLLLSLIPVSALQAQPQPTLQQLIEAGKFRAMVRLQNERRFVPGQEIDLTIELATNRWFAGGTRLEIPETESMLVVQRDKFAVNSSRDEGGQSWGVQTWQLSMFPQREGTYRTPPVRLTVTVNHERFGNVTGDVTVPSLEFAVVVPEALKSITGWVATPSLEVERTFDRPLDDLTIGDAFQSTLTIKGENLMAMMLPQSRLVDSEGLVAYVGFPKLINHQQRGEQSALRTEKVDYVIEEGGEFTLDEQVFYWWNTESNSLEMTVLPAVTFSVSGSPVRRWAVAIQNNSTLAWLPVAIVGLLILAATLFFWRHRQARPVLSERYLLRQIRRSVSDGDAGETCRWLYVWLDHYPGRGSIFTLRALAEEMQSEVFSAQLESVLADAYRNGDEQGALKLDVRSFQSRESRGLLRKLKPAKIDLRLEP